MAIPPSAGVRTSDSFPATKAESFLKRYYAPNNAIIAVVGDIRPAATIALVERYFGDIPPGTPVPEVAAQEELQQGERRVEVLGMPSRS